MSGSRSRNFDPVFRGGGELLLQKERGSASFGAKVVPSLNGVDLSFENSVAESYL
jgi:hypothetical protein